MARRNFWGLVWKKVQEQKHALQGKNLGGGP